MGKITALFVSVLFPALISLSAQAQENTTCISLKDMQEIGEHFSQIKGLIRNQKAVYCENDLGKEWFAISKSLEILKNITPDEPELDQSDAFTFKAISEKDWWGYFTNRASSFNLERECEEGVVAFVFGVFGGGKIHICPFFFEQNLYSQTSVMMHEVRHFDGFRHVTCSRGKEQGNSGACDTDITEKGSYAISVQTMVCLLYTSPSPRDQRGSRMPSSA